MLSEIDVDDPYGFDSYLDIQIEHENEGAASDGKQASQTMKSSIAEDQRTLYK